MRPICLIICKAYFAFCFDFMILKMILHVQKTAPVRELFEINNSLENR